MTKLVVGLGNTGQDYQNTRHNAGFLAVRWLANQWGIESEWSEKKKLSSFIARSQEPDVILTQPTTMMNSSGIAVRKVLDYYQLKPEDLTVIHDDADLPLGEIRTVEASQTGAGHHGVLSVIEHVGPGFKRVRIGIGRPDQPVRDISNYVLGRLTADERSQIEKSLTEHSII